jgi:hypothetical protein
MKKAQLQEAIDSHSMVVGAALDGKIIWVCLDSGNVLLSQTGEPTETWKNPEKSKLCSGALGCGHVLLAKAKRVKDMERVLQTLNHRKETVRADYLDQNLQLGGDAEGRPRATWGID